MPSDEDPPAVTWLSPEEVTISIGDTDEASAAAARLEIGFDHPKPHERHVLIDIPAGDTDKIVLRVFFRVQEHEVSTFVIQVEVKSTAAEYGSRSRPVVRYDCSHGFLHRDMIARDGTKTKVPLTGGDISSAVPALVSGTVRFR